jgi:flagellar protein FlgJ
VTRLLEVLRDLWRFIMGNDQPPSSRKTITTESTLKNVRAFVADFAEAAVAAEEVYGLPAEGMLAQAALETGWGQHILRGKDPTTGATVTSNNLFNIKKGRGWEGLIVNKRVHEYTKAGTKYYTTSPFRRYANYRESFEDYCLLITVAKRYKAAVAASSDFVRYLRAIQKAGYATDPDYADKCIRIVTKYFRVGSVSIDSP